MHPFLAGIKKLPCWPNKNQRNATPHLQNGHEIMFVVLYSIFSQCKEDKFEEIDYLYTYCKQWEISDLRQYELIQKLRMAHWNAVDYINKVGYKTFVDAYVKLSLYDHKMAFHELKLIYEAASCLKLDLHNDVSIIIRKILSSFRYCTILFFGRTSVSFLISVMIVLNAIQMGMLASYSFLNRKDYAWFFRIDFIFMVIFSIEILFRIYAFRKEFFNQAQNLFDFFVIAVSWIPIPGMRWISTLRILRTLLLVNRLQQLKLILRSLLSALPNISWIFMLMSLIYYVFAVMTTRLFGNNFAQFKTIPDSLFTLFQLMTLEGWPDLVKNVMSVYPYSWCLFIPFILISSYILLNLVVGIIVTTMQNKNQKTTGGRSEMEEILELKDKLHHVSQQLLILQRCIIEKQADKQPSLTNTSSTSPTSPNTSDTKQ